MNLPVLNQQFQLRSRNPEARKNFRASWGAKTEGIKEGDFVQGIILGFETTEFKSKNIIIKSLQTGQPLVVFACQSLQRELHSDEFFTQLLYKPGDVVQITYRGSYVGKKGIAQGKTVAVFAIDEIIGYTLTEQDIQDVRSFIQQQVSGATGLPQAPQPVQQPVYNQQQFAQVPPPAQFQSQYAAPQQNFHAQQQPKVGFKKTTEEQSFDV